MQDVFLTCDLRQWCLPWPEKNSGGGGSGRASLRLHMSLGPGSKPYYRAASFLPPARLHIPKVPLLPQAAPPAGMRCSNIRV